jgi:cytochrome o ubiquinol oxidase subunit 2
MNILDPLGPIGAADKAILIDSVAIMLAIVLPTIVAIFAFTFWFRASNASAIHLPHWAYSGQLELVVWSIPTLTILLLGGVAWIGAHQLDPARPIESAAKPLRIQAVSLDWKWLFIYPDENVATLNTLTVPVGVPLHFELTSASVMNAFFIPQLGSMIYTMNGMTNQLNLQADKVGTLRGRSSHFSGDGFSDMHFDVNVVAAAQFTQWSQGAAQAAQALDRNLYQKIALPSINDAPATYRLADPGLYASIVSQKIPPSPGGQSGVKGASPVPPQAADAALRHCVGVADAR